MFDTWDLSPTPPVDLPPTPTRASQYAAAEWDIPRVKQVLRLLDAGFFCHAIELRDWLRRDSRMAGAEGQLADTFCGFELELEEGERAHGNSPMEAMRRDARGLYGDDGSACGASLLRELIEDLAGFFYKPCWIHFAPSADGSRWEPRLTPWPLSSVSRDPDPTRPDRYVAHLDSGQTIRIEGENWIEFRRALTRNHRRGAVRTIAESWINRAFAIGDWGIASSGNAVKYVGQLPEEITEESPAGQLFAKNVARLGQPYSGMVHQHGGDVKALKPGELAHKIHMDYATLSASDYAIAYLGQDGTMSLGTSGTYGARQVLYGVAYDVIRGLATGVLEGLNEVERRRAFYNYGRTQHPRLELEVPDLEAEMSRSEAIKRREPMIAELQTLRALGPLTPDLVVVVGRRYGQDMSAEEVAAWSSSTSALTPAS